MIFFSFLIQTFYNMLNKHDLRLKPHPHFYWSFPLCLYLEKNHLPNASQKMPFNTVSRLIAFTWVTQILMLLRVITLAFDNQFKHESRGLSVAQRASALFLTTNEMSRKCLSIHSSCQAWLHCQKLTGTLLRKR